MPLAKAPCNVKSTVTAGLFFGLAINQDGVRADAGGICGMKALNEPAGQLFLSFWRIKRIGWLMFARRLHRGSPLDSSCLTCPRWSIRDFHNVPYLRRLSDNFVRPLRKVSSHVYEGIGQTPGACHAQTQRPTRCRVPKSVPARSICGPQLDLSPREPTP